ncbi:unnamed protein product, partial [Oppiella nova]
MYLKNPMEPPDVLGIQSDEPSVPKLANRNKKTIHLSDFKQIESKKINQFGYNKLQNEKVMVYKTNVSNLPRRSLSYTQLKTATDQWSEDQSNGQRDGVLIDLSDEVSVDSFTAQQIMTETHKALVSMSQPETSGQTHETQGVTASNEWSEERSYCNLPVESQELANSCKYYSPPLEFSDIPVNNEDSFSNKDRYYSAVASGEESQIQWTPSVPQNNIFGLNYNTNTNTNTTTNERQFD